MKHIVLFESFVKRSHLIEGFVCFHSAVAYKDTGRLISIGKIDGFWFGFTKDVEL